MARTSMMMGRKKLGVFLALTDQYAFPARACAWVWVTTVDGVAVARPVIAVVKVTGLAYT